MNILPKKRWHVRTKENIARVRRDEAAAAEKEKEEERRVQLAESEARIRYMKSRISSECEVQKEEIDKPSHINFFQELEDNEFASCKVNEEYEKEKKEEKEKYEKQIGYLTYLGQNTNEATGKTSWYNLPPANNQDIIDEDDENDLKRKYYLDPVNKYKKHFNFWNTKKNSNASNDKEKTTETSVKTERCLKKKKPAVTSSSSSSESSSDSEDDALVQERKLKQLRQKRLERERNERLRAEKVLAKWHGQSEADKKAASSGEVAFEQKYNSQFNPHLAKQNVVKQNSSDNKRSRH